MNSRRIIVMLLLSTTSSFMFLLNNNLSTTTTSGRTFSLGFTSTPDARGEDAHPVEHASSSNACKDCKFGHKGSFFFLSHRLHSWPTQ